MHVTGGPLKGEDVQLEQVSEKDLPKLWKMIYEEDHPEWRKWDSPFYSIQPLEYEKFHDQMLNLLKQGLNKQLVIKVKGELIGVIYYQWEHESSNSIEIGSDIYRSDYHDMKYEIDALKTWMNYLFTHFPIPRIGISTWSGNERMVSIGQALGMMIEGRIRKNRLYRGKYYDSVKLGILREEWEELQKD